MRQEQSQTKSGALKFSEYFVYIFFATFPFLTYKYFLYGGTSSRSANLIIVAAILGIVISIRLLVRNQPLSIPKSPVFLAALVYLVSVTISALAGLNFETSFWSTVARTTGIWYFIHLGFFSWVIFELFSDQDRHRKLILVITVSTALYSLLAFLGPEGVGLAFSGYIGDAFTFGNSTFAGMYIFGAFLLSIYYLFQAEAKKWWMYVLPIIIIINPYILGAGLYGNPDGELWGEARTSMIAVAFSIICLLGIWLVSKIKDYKTRARVSYSIFGVSIVLFMVFAYSLLSPGGAFREIYLSQASAARPLIWETSERVIRERPILGWGVDNFERVFEKNYDNRLLQDEYGGESWFDRAHNIFIDQLVDNGIVGLTFYLLAYVVVILCLIYVSLRSEERRDRVLSSILIVYFTLHLLELQTAFDTSISYVMVAFMIASAAILFHRTICQSKGVTHSYLLPQTAKYAAASALLIFFVWSIVWGWLPFVRAQVTHGAIRTVGNSEKRVSLYATMLDSPIDAHAFIWRSSIDFQVAISMDPGIIEDPQKMARLRKEVQAFEQGHRDIIRENPTHFRAHLNLADMLIYQNLFGVNELAEAQKVLDDAIKLVPQSPQPYWMKAVAYLYMKKFDLAKEYARKGLELNPSVKESDRVVKYIDDSIKTFPEIELFFFKYI